MDNSTTDSIEKKANDEEFEIGFDRNVNFDTSRDGFLNHQHREVSFSNQRPQPRAVLPGVFRTISYTIDDTVKSVHSQESEIDKNSKKFLDSTWHIDTVDDVVSKLSTNLSVGLSSTAIPSPQKKYGLNVQPKPQTNLLKKYFMYFFGGFGSLLFAGGILVIICYKPLGDPPAVANLALGIVLLAVFLVQAAFNWYQDFSSSKVMDSIHNMIPADVLVLRDGSYVTVEGKNLVPGDIIKIPNGSKVPADIRITDCSDNFAFDRSILTGESKPVVCSSAPSTNPNYLESQCIALQGTYCIGGSGSGIVVSISDSTVFGTIAKLASKPKTGMSTLQLEVFRYVLIVCVVIIILDILFIVLWAAWLRRDYPDWISVPTLIVDIVSIAVSFIPEGLPMSLTMCLMITAKQMKASNILCKSLAVVETLGAVDVLCSDKTGTLTANNMVVTSHFTKNEKEAEKLKLIGALCNESFVDSKGDVIEGNATDKAILKFSIQSELNAKEYTLVKTISFSSKFKFMMKLYHHGTDYFLTIKGAPDVLMDRCTTILDNENVITFDQQIKQDVVETQLGFAENGERVVSIAYKTIPISKYSEDELMNMSDFTFVGLVGISDPLRHGIPEVVSDLKTAGIKVIMVTGDFAATALAISRNCGIITESKVDYIDDLHEGGIALVVNGPEMYRLSEVDWDKLCSYKEIVFSRTTPDQKLRIVKEFQSRKSKVAMTGDGINDSPSLKQADVGISMADATEVAKEASDLILMESFLSIIDALKFGRLVFENLRKIICYLLPAGCFAELWAILMNVLFGVPQVLSSFFMIIICIWTDCIAATCLTYEHPEKNLLNKKPRTVTGERLVDLKLFGHAYLTIGTYYAFTSMLLAFLNFQRRGVPFGDMILKYGNYPDPDLVNEVLKQSSSIYFMNLVIMQFFNAMAVRTRVLSVFQQKINWKLFIAIPFIFASTFIFNYIPAVQPVITSSSIPVQYYFISIGFGTLVLVYDEL